MKIINMQVAACKFCPFLYTDGFRNNMGLCRNTMDQTLVMNLDEIPTWCPLSDDSEQEQEQEKSAGK